MTAVSANSEWSVTYAALAEEYTFSILPSTTVVVQKADLDLSTVRWSDHLIRVQSDASQTILDWRKETSLSATDRADLITKIQELGIDTKGGKMTNDTIYSLPNFTIYTVPWPNELRDDLDFHDPVTNNSRITNTSNSTLDLVVAWNVRFDATAVTTAWFTGFLFKNGNTAGERFSQITFPRASAFPTFLASSAVVRLDPGDYVELAVNQITGGNIDFGSTTSGQENQITYSVL